MKYRHHLNGLMMASMTIVAAAAHAGPTNSRTAFEAALQGIKIEGFETPPLTSSAAPLDLYFGTASPLAVIPAYIAGPPPSGDPNFPGFGGVTNSAVPILGRFATVGTGWWDSGGNFEIRCASGVDAFRIYITDLGDFALDCEALKDNDPDVICPASSQGLVISFYSGGDKLGDWQSVGNALNGDPVNNPALFAGFTRDDARKITRITFDNQSGGYDGIGFDQATIGDLTGLPNPTPEPSTLILGAASLLLLMRCRRNSRDK